jgi:hypothetical protein
LPALGHVGVQAKDGDERRYERPVDVGLGHARPPGALALAGDLGAARAKVGQEAVECGRAREWVAVVVAGNREDRRRIVRIRLVELRRVLAYFPVVVDAVA